MATYRINGIKYNPANWAGLDKAERAGVARFVAQRERELNTITTAEHVCHGGPFDGALISIDATTTQTAPMTVGAWAGSYKLVSDLDHLPEWQRKTAHIDAKKRLQWVGNDGGKAIATHAKASSATAPEVTQKGFGQLRDLLADLAEDVSEKEKIVTMHGRKITWAVGAVDDFGNAIAGDVPTHCNQVMEKLPPVRGSKKRRYLLTERHGHGSLFMDGWGNLQKAPQPRIHAADFPVPCERVQYRIGATTYTVKAAAESVANLRAKIIKAKRWFADAMLPGAQDAGQAAEPVAEPTPADAMADTGAAHQVRQVLADAAAAAAIATAQESAADADTTAHQEPELVTCEADEVHALATVAQASHTTPGAPNMPASHQGTGYASTTPAPRTGTGAAPGARTGQRITGKSGRWSATFHTDTDGKPGMLYTGPDGAATAHSFANGADRMATLQHLARQADAPATPATPATPTTPATPATPASTASQAKPASQAHTPPALPADGAAAPGVCPASGPDYTDPLKIMAGDYTGSLKIMAGNADAKTPSQPLHPRNIVPQGGRHIVEDAFEAWTYYHEKSGRFGFVMYLGKQSKPYAYYGYATKVKRDAGFERHAQQARDILASKAKRKAYDRAKLDAGHGLQVGDVVRSSWGYDQTNVDYYQITKVIGKRTVEVRALAVHEESTGHMSGRVAPVWGEFAGEAMRRQVDKYGEVNILSATYGRASKIDPVAIVHGVRCYAASHCSSYA